ncbi:MAG: nuclear transport factor 2 family protein [Rhodothermales bacterium]|nr:nuclear transport factor 2 family protein [Rhodothermales bacterium]MBO6778315.1 nuclear transport factor 2 family protein [Rhodothermales bacterium]
MRTSLIPVLALVLLPGLAVAQDAESDVSSVLDQLHLKASEGDFEGYFSLYAENAVFFGTDASERWPLEIFKDYTRGRFAEGTAWTYHMLERNIDFSPSGEVAWFDELLTNDRLGLTRGTGVLVRQDDGWLITQYHLTIPVPNELAVPFVEIIKVHEASQ